MIIQAGIWTIVFQSTFFSCCKNKWLLNLLANYFSINLLNNLDNQNIFLPHPLLPPFGEGEG
jgi:hypothetical protein